MNIITTLIPIFTIIAIGWFAKNRGFMPSEFTGPANRLVYYLAIPAMIFRSISKSSLTIHLNFSVIAITLSSILIICIIARVASIGVRLERWQFGTFLQSSFHGNLGYIGLAISYYYLGDEGFVRASIIAGFMMILQNVLAVFVLQFYAEDCKGTLRSFSPFLRVLGNPVIVSAIAGILFSLTGMKIPLMMGRPLDILSGMGLPMALLIIGASLSFNVVRFRIRAILMTSIIKLLILPGVGLSLYQFFGLFPKEYLPGLILLASPTATISYIMAREMNGDADFSVGAISASTILSVLTFSLWLNLA